MISKQGKVNNLYGIHLRPSMDIFKVFKDYGGDLQVVKSNGESASVKSLLDLQALGLAFGHEFTVVSNNDDAEAVDKLVSMLEALYDYKR